MSIAEEAASQSAERRFAAFVRELRTLSGIPQAEVARYMTSNGWGWKQQTVTKFETGKRMIRLGEAVALASLLNFDLGTFADDIRMQPFCRTCGGLPPAGFTCNTCRSSANS